MALIWVFLKLSYPCLILRRDTRLVEINETQAVLFRGGEVLVFSPVVYNENRTIYELPSVGIIEEFSTGNNHFQ